MCQSCVEKGIITQEELDAKTEAGDTSVIPLQDLPISDALGILVNLVMAGRMDMITARGVATYLGRRNRAASEVPE